MHANLPAPFSETEVQSLLAEQSRGNTWERPLPEAMWYMTERGKKELIAAAAYYPKLPRAGQPAFTVITATYARQHKILHI
jgi:phytoene/squalene synthetase